MRLRQAVGRGADSAPRGCEVAAAALPLPVVVYLPGWPGTQIDNFRLLGALASRGYLVAALTYPGRQPQGMDYSSAAACARTEALAAERLRQGVEDVAALLDALPKAFSGYCDVARVGVVGFSFGGAIAAECPSFEPRVGAAVNIDGRHWMGALEHGVEVPYLFIGEELLMPTADAIAAAHPSRRRDLKLDQIDYAHLAANLRRNGGTQVVIHGSGHLNFTDGALRARWRRLPDTGRIAPRRCLQILETYVTAFLQQELRGIPSGVLSSGAQPFAEATCQVWPRAVGVHTR